MNGLRQYKSWILVVTDQGIPVHLCQFLHYLGINVIDCLLKILFNCVSILLKLLSDVEFHEFLLLELYKSHLLIKDSILLSFKSIFFILHLHRKHFKLIQSLILLNIFMDLWLGRLFLELAVNKVDLGFINNLFFFLLLLELHVMKRVIWILVHDLLYGFLFIPRLFFRLVLLIIFRLVGGARP